MYMYVCLKTHREKLLSGSLCVLNCMQTSDVLLERQKERLITSRQDEYHKRQWSNLFYSPARIDPFADGKKYLSIVDSL